MVENQGNSKEVVEVVTEVVEEKVEKATEVVEEKVEKATEVVEEKVEEATEVVEEKVEEATEVVEEKVEKATEVVKEAVEEPVASMDDFVEELEKSMTKVSVGDIIECQIITITEDEMSVNLGYVADGLIKKEDIYLEKNQTLGDAYKVEGTIKAEVVKMNDGEGNVLLSAKKAEKVIIWDDLEAIYKNGDTMKVTISNKVKGGLVASVRGVRIFMPASMLSVSYVEDLGTWVGKELEVKIKDFDRSDSKVIVSHKEIDQKNRKVEKAAFFQEVEEGQTFNGTVKKLMNFGAFVNLGPVDGLLHINEMSWKRIKHPSDVMKEKDVVEVYIISIDKEKEKISLGLKNIGENPWDNIFDHFTIGNIYDGQVARNAGFGSFVRIGDGIDGLVHISEISNEHIKSPSDVLTEGDKVKVKVLTIDKEAKKIGLSIKATQAGEVSVKVADFATEEKATTSLESVFKDALKGFKFE